MSDPEIYPEGMNRRVAIRYGASTVRISVTHRAELGGLAELAAFCQRNRGKPILFVEDGVTYRVGFRNSPSSRPSVLIETEKEMVTGNESQVAKVELVVEEE